ncbi:MAG: 50S ribosomal protein L23 [Nitrospinota bacterium]|jgi:large subunit ribosomal protein L23|nr:50S ribosomal protein L23 [Nitrospinota bacterium]MDP7349931.1 50S ribosomal protein L23 [Nitrospinota bacterium]HJN03445.1 50S ribosomal protein L23 [Nitrospinota bacterium]|tara:strand:+ start:306 stop:596 length:291 start_codon:yes stop_codon:yes gene_type:complete
MKDIYRVIVKPLITEKSTDQQASHNKYTFQTNLRANKHEIKAAVEELFKVKVIDVRTCVYHGKKAKVGRNSGFKPEWKKAIVTVKEGDSIQLFEGV